MKQLLIVLAAIILGFAKSSDAAAQASLDYETRMANEIEAVGTYTSALQLLHIPLAEALASETLFDVRDALATDAPLPDSRELVRELLSAKRRTQRNLTSLEAVPALPILAEISEIDDTLRFQADAARKVTHTLTGSVDEILAIIDGLNQATNSQDRQDASVALQRIDLGVLIAASQYDVDVNAVAKQAIDGNVNPRYYELVLTERLGRASLQEAYIGLSDLDAPESETLSQAQARREPFLAEMESHLNGWDTDVSAAKAVYPAMRRLFAKAQGAVEGDLVDMFAGFDKLEASFNRSFSAFSDVAEAKRNIITAYRTAATIDALDAALDQAYDRESAAYIAIEEEDALRRTLLLQ